MSKLKIGVVGYSAQEFDKEAAETCIKNAYEYITHNYPDKNKTVVSGLSDLGIPAIAYREAEKRDWKTVGIACSKARDYECFPVDEEVIVGDEWGDESKTFLESIDVLVRVGGGEQTKKETEEFRKMTFKNKDSNSLILEYELPSLDSS